MDKQEIPICCIIYMRKSASECSDSSMSSLVIFLIVPTVAQMGGKRENWTLFQANYKGTNQLAQPYSRSDGPEVRKLDFVSRQQQRHKPACTSLQSLRWAGSEKTGLCFMQTTKAQTSLHNPTVAQMGRNRENWTLFHGNNKGTNQLAHPYSRSDGPEARKLDFVSHEQQSQTSLHIPTVAQMGRKRENWTLFHTNNKGTNQLAHPYSRSDGPESENWTLFHGNNKGTNQLAHPYSRSDGPEARKLDFVSHEQQSHKPACTSLQSLRWARSEKTGLCFTRTTKAQTSLHILTVTQMGRKRENWTLFHVNNKGTNQLAHPYSRSDGPEARKLDFVSREQQRHKPACTSLQSEKPRLLFQQPEMPASTA